MSPIISVIIPAYNAEKKIRFAIESLLSQSCQNLEIIVIDDGSTDKTAEVAKSYGDKVNYYYQENKGVAIARNFGVLMAKGQYVGFLDADDYVLPEMYQSMLDNGKINNSDIVICNLYFENENGVRRKGLFYNNMTLDLNQTSHLKLAFKNIGNSCCNKIYRKSLIQFIQFPSLKRGEDALFVLESLLNAKFVTFIKEPLYVYFQNTASVSKSGITVDVLKNYEKVNIEKRNLIKNNKQFETLSPLLREYYKRYFLMYTNGIRKIKNRFVRDTCWQTWLNINKNDFVKTTSFNMIFNVSKNINWVYYAGMIMSGNFKRSVLNRINNINYYFKIKS